MAHFDGILYRTSDVIAWWSDLEQRRRHDILAGEARWLRLRRWDGPGMAVDVDALERWMEEYKARRIAVRLRDREVVLL